MSNKKKTVEENKDETVKTDNFELVSKLLRIVGVDINPSLVESVIALNEKVDKVGKHITVSEVEKIIDDIVEKSTPKPPRKENMEKV